MASWAEITKSTVKSMENSRQIIIRSTSLLKQIYFIIVLLLATGRNHLPWVGCGRTEPNYNSSGDTITQILWIILYATGLVFSLCRWCRIKPFLRHNLIIILLTSYAFFSIFWSDQPFLTARRSVALIGTTIVGIYLGTQVKQLELLRLLVCSLTILIIMSIINVIFFPECALQNFMNSDAWRGVLGHKNTFGAAMILNCLAWLSLIYVLSGWSKFIGIAFFVLSFILTLLSRSMTSIFAFLGFAFPILVYLTSKFNRFLILGILCLLSALTVLLASETLTDISFYKFDTIAYTYLGRDLTLTGRTDLWSAVCESISKNFLFGHGYSAFWLGMEGPSASIWNTLGKMHHSHNGFLDLWLQLGIFGVAFCVLLFFQFGIRVVRYIRLGGKFDEYFFPFAFLCVFFLTNLAESNILTRNYIYWILFVAALFSLTPNIGTEKNSLNSHELHEKSGPL